MKVNANGLAVYRAALDYPVGVNASYGCGKGRFHKNRGADKWIKKAVSDLHQQGFEPIEEHTYWCSIRYVLSSVRMDTDGPVKAILDAIAESLSLEVQVDKKKKLIGFNDKWVGTIEAHKILVDHYVDQGLTVRVILGQITDKAAFNDIEREMGTDFTLDRAMQLSRKGYFLRES